MIPIDIFYYLQNTDYIIIVIGLTNTPIGNNKYTRIV
jgi:hypothetical protein